MSSFLSLFLSGQTTIEAIDVPGEPAIVIRGAAPDQLDVTLFLGQSAHPRSRAIALDQLGELQAAVSACYQLLGETAAPRPGPDDPTDDPTDDPAIPPLTARPLESVLADLGNDEPADPGADALGRLALATILDAEYPALTAQGPEPMGGWEPRS